MDQPTSADGLFQEPKVKRWLIAQVAAFIVWLFVATVMGVSGVPFPVELVVLVVAALIFSVFIDPRRSWWGQGPAHVMNDATARRRYRRLMILWLFVALAFAWVLVMVLVATGIVVPAGSTTS